MRVVVFQSLLAVLALSASVPAFAAAAVTTEPPAKVFRGEEIAILLLGVAGVMIGHIGSRSRKPGEDPKA